MSPYRERAILALAQHLERALGHRFIELQAAGGRGALRYAPKQLSSWGLPLLLVASAEAVRIISGRLGSPRLALYGMWVQKYIVDVVASWRLTRINPAACIGLPGASLKSFEAATNAVRVLHQVDAHPLAHNEALVDAPENYEQYPEILVRRIQAEIELAHHILVPSRVVWQQFVDFGCSPAKLVLVPYGVDLELFKPRASTDQVNPRPVMLYVGQISVRKGIDVLIAACRGADFDLRLIGNVFDRRLIMDLPLNVSVHPPLSHSLLAQEFAQADALVLASREDAFGLVLTEAAASGLQLVATKAVGATEVLGDLVLVTEPASQVALRQVLDRVTVLTQAERAKRIRKLAATSVDDWATYGMRVSSALDLA